MEDYLHPIFNGILFGGLYAAVGVGMSMSFGIVKQVNLAHGDLMIVASYLTMILISGMPFLTPWTALILVIPAMFLIGFLFQKYLLNRFLGLGMEPPLIVAFGLSIIIQNGLLVLFSPDARLLETPLAINTPNCCSCLLFCTWPWGNSGTSWAVTPAWSLWANRSSSAWAATP